jgi:predicted metal-dependent hydrolase
MYKSTLSEDIPAPTLIRSRRRSIALEICPDGTFIVRAPHLAGEEAIREFISRKRDWINKVYDRTRGQLALFRPKQFIEGERFPYLGNEYILHIAPDMHGKLIFEDRFILNERFLPRARILFERWYKEEAFMFFTVRCKFYAGNMGVRYNSIDLSNAKHRWGSCYSNGNLRFNWRLVMAPENIVDYVVVHELAHLVEPNHSNRFWGVVDKTFQNHREARKWLKDNHLLLSL